MQETDDIELLRRYAEHHSEAAFATLVERHINLVYSVALRHVGNPHHAEEITQAVFVILARKSGQIRRSVVLPGWLYHAARLTAANFLRSETQRARREQEAYMQSNPNETEPEVWLQLAPLLDRAMAGLGEKDRDAVVLRFFEDKKMHEVGTALGMSEEAAKKRTARAVEKLRRFFTKRGVVVPAAVFTAAVSANSVQAAPAMLTITTTAVAMAKGAAASASTLTLIKGAMKLMAWTKAKMAVVTGVIILLVAGGATTVIISERHANFLAAVKILKAVEAKYVSFSTFTYSGEMVIQSQGARPTATVSVRLARPCIYWREMDYSNGTNTQEFASWTTDDYRFTYISTTNKLYKSKTTLDERLAIYESMNLGISMSADLPISLFFNQKPDDFLRIFSKDESSLKIEKLDDGVAGLTDCYRLRVTLPQHAVSFILWIGKTDNLVYQTEQSFELGKFNDIARVTYHDQSANMPLETNDFIPEVPAGLKLSDTYP
jgi:RNA polymerase sigma factor (sigma-70 family)